jgi:hypothetical protein
MRSGDHLLGWRSHLKWVINKDGYEIETRKQEGGMHPKNTNLLMPKSDKYTQVHYLGLAAKCYEAFLNLAIGDYKTNSILFSNQYGPLYEASDSLISAEELLSKSHEKRIFLEKIIKAKQSSKPFHLILGDIEYPTIFLDASAKGSELIVAPSSLLGFIELQIAELVARGRNIGKCSVCGKFFSPERNTRRFCSPSCRSSAHRAEKRKAS